jgi:hypothetical protein
MCTRLSYSIKDKFGVDRENFELEFLPQLKGLNSNDNIEKIEKLGQQSYLDSISKSVDIELKLDELASIMCNADIFNKYAKRKIMESDLICNNEYAQLDDINKTLTSEMYSEIVYNFKNYIDDDRLPEALYNYTLFPNELIKLITSYTIKPVITYNYSIYIDQVPISCKYNIYRNMIIKDKRILFDLECVDVNLEHRHNHTYSHPHDCEYVFYKIDEGQMRFKDQIVKYYNDKPELINISQHSIKVEFTNTIYEFEYRDMSMLDELLENMYGIVGRGSPDTTRSNCCFRDRFKSRFVIVRDYTDGKIDSHMDEGYQYNKYMICCSEVYNDHSSKLLITATIREHIKRVLDANSINQYLLIIQFNHHEVSINIIDSGKINDLISDLEFIRKYRKSIESIISDCPYRLGQCPFDYDTSLVWYMDLNNEVHYGHEE